MCRSAEENNSVRIGKELIYCGLEEFFRDPIMNLRDDLLKCYDLISGAFQILMFCNFSVFPDKERKSHIL